MKVLSTAVMIALLSLTAGLGRASEIRNPDVREQLLSVEADYEWNSQNKQFVLDKRSDIAEILSQHPHDENLLKQLVACMSDTRPSKAKLNGRRVPVGVICYEALTSLVYVELTPSWLGDVTPTADIRKLKSGQRAWKSVIERKAYIWL